MTKPLVAQVLEVRSFGIARLLDDLGRATRSGITDEECSSVTDALTAIADAVAADGNTVWQVCDDLPLREFLHTYVAWNDVPREETTANALKRKQLLKELRRLSRSVDALLRKFDAGRMPNGRALSSEDLLKSRELFSYLSGVSDKHPSTFKSLRSAVVSFAA